MIEVRRLSVLLLISVLFGLPAFLSVAQSQGPDLKTGVLRRGPDGKLYLDAPPPPPPPPAAEAAPTAPEAESAPALPAGVAAAPTLHGPRSLSVCATGCNFTSLSQALTNAGTGDTISIAPGLYAEAGVIKADHVKVIGGPGVRMKGVAADGKAAIVVSGNDTLIEGIDCSEIAVPDHNGSCVRLEGHNLTLRHVHFHDAEEGVLTAPDTGVMTIEDSTLERLGAGGLAHAIYAGAMDTVIIRRCAILSSRGEGHEVKSRAAHLIIENSLIASLDGLDSRDIDVPNGGELVVRDSILEKGVNSSVSEVIGFGLEGIKHSVNSVRLEHVSVIVDRRDGSFLNGPTNLTLADVKIIGGKDPLDDRAKWLASRDAAGLPSYPELPAVAGVTRIYAVQHSTSRVCPIGCDYSTLTDALRQASTGSTITLEAGVYHEGGIIRANHVTLKAEPEAKLAGGAVEGKAALVVKGDDAVIVGLDCSKIAVDDMNGACVRLEGRNLTLRKVYFHDSQEGLLVNDDAGDILIEDSKFERLGANGRAHAIYVGKSNSLTLRRSSVLATTGKGHGVKTRTAHTLIEHSVIASLNGQDSRLIDAANGGEVVIRDSLLEKGPSSDNPEAIAFGLEGMSYPANVLRIENCQILLDRPDSKLARSLVHGTMTGGRVIGGDLGLAKKLVGSLTDLVAPGRFGDNFTIADDVKVFPDRPSAGLAAFPALPTL